MTLFCRVKADSRVNRTDAYNGWRWIDSTTAWHDAKPRSKCNLNTGWATKADEGDWLNMRRRRKVSKSI